MDWNKYHPIFKPEEFTCRCGCGANRMQTHHMDMLFKARAIAGIPFVITSGFRCRDHNRRVGGSRNSDHLGGYGSDIRCNDSGTRWALVDALIQAGFRRIGITASFVHAGNDPANPQDVIWTY